jgi:hypothetical protein
MIKLPFSRKTQDEPIERPSVAFAAYCEAERERRRDMADGLDERRFQAALDLALQRLQSLETAEGRS